MIEVLKAGTSENPFSQDVEIQHESTHRYFCQACDFQSNRSDKLEAIQLYLLHQRKKHNIKHPTIHSFEPDDADEYWIQNYV